MKKKYISLTAEQKKRGVVFASRLMPHGTLHEVLGYAPDRDKQIERLLEDSFFNDSPYEYNEVAQ